MKMLVEEFLRTLVSVLGESWHRERGCGLARLLS